MSHKGPVGHSPSASSRFRLVAGCHGDSGSSMVYPAHAQDPVISENTEELDVGKTLGVLGKTQASLWPVPTFWLRSSFLIVSGAAKHCHRASR